MATGGGGITRKQEELMSEAKGAKLLTMSQVRRICREHKYLTFRAYNDSTITVNGRIADIIWRKKEFHGNKRSKAVSYRPITLDEYISNKAVFVRTNDNH